MSAVFFWLGLTLFAAWSATALWVQFPETRLLALGVFVLACAAVIWLRLSGGHSWPGLVALVAVTLGWYLSLTPRQDRDWAPDVAHSVSGRIEGNLVHLSNLRNFRWKTADLAEEAWSERTVDLNRITGADMITSVWGNPDIAHLLVTFRFQDETPITFSVEIRREKGESFSALGGFFRQFELALIAADEADIVAWRAVPRGEEVRLYPLTLTPAQLGQLFVRYIELGNELNAKPRWYNTLLSNCTTVAWQLSKVLKQDLPLDPSLLLSGRLPEYLDKFGVLAGDGTLAEKRERALISPRAREQPPGTDFSEWIRP